MLDTHVVQWWAAEPDRLSLNAREAIEAADELVVAAITWFELAWLATHGRISTTLPVRAWLNELNRELKTVPLGPAVAATAVSLPTRFPADPADRLIFATAVESGSRLVTKDRRIRAHPYPRPVALW